MYMTEQVCVCVCSRKGRQSGTSVGFTPGNWAYISHRAYARLFRVVKTMQNALTIDPRGTLVVYMHLPALHTCMCVNDSWHHSNGENQKVLHTSPIVVYDPC